MTATIDAPTYDLIRELGDPVKTLTFPISVDYVKRWDLDQGLAEFVSNAIDAVAGTRNPNGYHVTYDPIREELTIEDEAAEGIGAEGMVFGFSDKGNSQIGQFGEGMKIATIRAVSDPNIRYMRIDTVGYTFVPGVTTHTSIAGLNIPSRTSNPPKVLVWDLYPSDRKRGTLVRVGVAEDIARKVIARFRHLTIPGYTPPLGHGEIIRDEPGNIYIGGVYVKTVPNMKYGYDLGLAAAKSFQNRDRTIVEDWKVRSTVREIHDSITDRDLLAELVSAAIAGELPEVERDFVYGYGTKTAGVLRLWREVAEQLLGNPDTRYYRDGNSWNVDEAVLDMGDRGLTVVEVQGLTSHETDNLMRRLGVKPLSQVAKAREKRVPRVSWTKKVPAAQQATLDRAVSILRKVYGTDVIEKVRVYDAVNDHTNTCALEWGGFYDPNNGTIAVALTQLGSLNQALSVLFHEATHRAAHRGLAGLAAGREYSDRTRGFENALGDLAVVALTMLDDHGVLDTVTPPKVTANPPEWTEKRYKPMPSGMEWVWRDGPVTGPSGRATTASYASRIVRAALNEWADKNGVKRERAHIEFAKRNYVTSAAVRAVCSATTAKSVTYTYIHDVCKPLGVDPAAIWFALTVPHGVWNGSTNGTARRHLSKRVASWKVPVSMSEQFDHALEDVTDPTVRAELTVMRDGTWEDPKAGPGQHSDEWLHPIVALLDAAADGRDLPPFEGLEGHPDPVEAWNVLFAGTDQ